ncbi:phosphatidylglycerophosphatase [Halothermothrix orenii H 168]|uniref:Phosphatidylglycerophosphatase n=2 Tax=Halothermothrix orenii TaxID=31909 RepID=B8CXC6_HALOH|nr:phosphatidylglycerophosphatase [Halothermothrix orenii H 168]
MFRILNKVIATGFFSGYLPVAPGTWGSLLALILIIFFPGLLTIPVLLLTIVTGITVASLEENFTGIKDKPSIVIDEITGIFITFTGVEINWWVLLAGFILFRFFDIFKPFPINRSQNLPSGLGIMMDDILAGLLSMSIIKLVFIFI